ncbi:PREDICTED: uncharacterized protein LOC104731882 [Camelina sativa]|uniref:Uncharacterized protein LOC104731882 n=1 Tax=Camelina sativa TaxID=90675 RepID=A0ABM0V258_CAMSA|nr:PREDICTED: uncharacterized protein LOC104731882 [Camelina sativa]
MEAFEHMIVDEFTEEDFYETIEAPKFVDLTAPDHRPEGDDRYWFCSRVGCDQKHEEFMDSEAIYKKFVLRVMAARSPSVRLRKALYRKDFSVDPKCPNTVPAKPSRSRVSRLAMISAIPQKCNGNVIRSKEVKVVSTNRNATPKSKVKGKESSVISSVPQKALTERKKQMQSPAAFRSVQNPRNAKIKVSENRLVAKALVFQSPKKLVKLKRSVELSSSVKKLCNGMRKLEIENKSNVLGVNYKAGSSVPSRRPLKTREVKSRVFDSVRSQEQNDSNTKGVSTMKKRLKKKEEPVLASYPSKAHEANGMRLEDQSLPRTEKTSGDEELVVENKSEELSDTLKANMNNQLQATEDPAVVKGSAEIEEKENALALECEDKENATIAAAVDREDISVIKVSELNKAKQFETVEIEDKENALPLECENKENATNATDVVDREGDDKENSSALDNNRKVDQATYPLLKKKVFGKKENCKTTQKVMTVADKCFNGKTVSAGTRVKYTKPKLTNPKPFRLRTDERQILKEAHTEKKPQCTLAKEETASIMGFHSENLGPKHQPVRVEKNTTSRLKAPRGTSTTLVSENMINSKRVALSRKKQVAPRKEIKTVKETSQVNGESKEVAIINKPAVCAIASGEKRHATVPKGPNFHSIHIPKSCTKRVASQV